MDIYNIYKLLYTCLISWHCGSKSVYLMDLSLSIFFYFFTLQYRIGFAIYQYEFLIMIVEWMIKFFVSLSHMSL